jgi:hypothetical protein
LQVIIFLIFKQLVFAHILIKKIVGILLKEILNVRYSVFILRFVIQCSCNYICWWWFFDLYDLIFYIYIFYIFHKHFEGVVYGAPDPSVGFVNLIEKQVGTDYIIHNYGVTGTTITGRDHIDANLYTPYTETDYYQRLL